MPAPALISWRGLEITPAADGSLRQVCLAGHATPVITGLNVVFGPGWEHDVTELLVDEIEQRHTYREGGRQLAHAVVRQVFDDAWSLRVQIVNDTAEQVSVAPARLEFTSAWPARRWLAGAEGSISLDVGRDDRALLTFTQLRGRSRLSEGCTWLTDLPVVLGPRSEPAASYLVSWRVDWLRDERMQAAALPMWWPERHVLAEGDIVELRLPDAAIEAAGISILEDDEVSVLTARPGRHLAQVHAGRGTTDLELSWAAPLVTGHLVPAAERLLARDPRSLQGHEVFLLGRALAARPLGERALEQLVDAVEALAARLTQQAEPGAQPRGGSRPDPLALAALADEAIRTGDPALADALAQIAPTLALVPGAITCLLHAGLAARLVTGGRALPMPVAELPDGAVERAIVSTELLLLNPPPRLPVATERLAALLGAGMPGVVLEPELRSVLWAVLGQLPEGWEPGERWPVGLGAARDMARDELLAQGCDDRTLAWLLW